MKTDNVCECVCDCENDARACMRSQYTLNALRQDKVNGCQNVFNIHI